MCNGILKATAFKQMTTFILSEEKETKTQKMAEITNLYDWRFDLRRDGRFYIVGTLGCGKRWETSQVLELTTFDNCYRVTTWNNSIYILKF
jgi:hypothetical protein